MLNSWLGKLLGLLFLVSMSFADTRQLAQGWNLVSVPISQPTAVGTWLAGKNLTTVTKIWTYDGGWKSWVPGQTEESASLFSSFTVNRGYWFLLSSAATYEFSPSDAALQPLELSATGWTMVGFGNQGSLSFETQVLAQSNIDASHEPQNISRVWGYEAVGNAGWKSYIPGAANNSDTSTTTMNPGMAHWFLVQNFNGKPVANDNRMTITPTGAAGSAALVIGGATSLTPPGVSLSVSTIPGFTGVGSASSTGACTASTSGVYARAFNLSGVQISDDELSQVCYTNPATYQVGFSSAKKAWLATNPDVANNLVIKVQLSGGQSVKTIVADEFKGKNINSISRTEDKTADAGSTLGVAMASVELAKKAGVPTDRFKLGEANSGMNMALESIKTISQKKDIELKGFTEAINAAAKDPNSVMGQMASRITNFNASATASTTAAADNVVRLLTGAPGTGISSTVLNSALSVGSKGMELFANQAKSSDRGIASTGDNATKLSALGTKLMAATPSDTALINTADIITRSLGMATVTSNDKVLGGLLKGNLEKALGKLDVNSLSGSGTDAVTRAMDIAGEALALPSALVSNLAQNREAASQFAGLVGQSNVLLKQVERDDKTRTGGKVLEKNSGAASKLSESKNVFAQMAQNAPDSTALNNMIAAAVGSAAGDSNAGKELFDTIGTIRTAIATGNLKVDFAAVASAAVQNSGDIQQVAILMARNAGDASDAANVLKQFKSVLPESTMGEVLADDRIANEFGLGSRIFVDAGPTQTIKVGSNGQANIVLDGSGTYDPQASTNLSYVWSRVSADGSTLSTVSTRIVTSVLESGLPINGREVRTYRLSVTDTVNKRKAEADVQILFQSNVPPVLLAPQYLSVQANETFFMDLSQSFDPENFESLTFSATGVAGDGLNIENPNDFASSGFLMAKYEGEGRKSITVQASKPDGAFTTQAVTIRVEGALPPYADAGFDIVVGTAEVNSGFVQMDNWSFSVQGNLLSYEWSPANHFRSTQANAGATSEFPIFTTTAPGTYTVNLVVTDTVTQAKSSDSAVVIVRRGQPPYADAGFAQVVRGSGTQNVTLDGSFSFSFTNDEPTYEWSGPEGVIGTQSTVTTAINLDLYTSRTKLTYKLKVTDANGSSEATVDVFVVPQASAAAPVVIVERFPALREYSPGDSIFLDASQSFSPTGEALKYSWTVQGTGLEVSDTTQSYVSMSIPASFTGTQVPVVLEVTAGLSSKTRREFNLSVVSRQLPPVAVASPNFIFLEDVANGATPRPPIRVSCFDSFSFTGNDSDLTCSWRLNSTNVVIAEGNSTDKVIGLRAKAGLTDDATATVTLTVKDTSSGLTATDTVFVNLKAFRAQGALPMFVDAHIEQMFENGRAYPAMNPNRMNEFTFFDFGGSQLEKKQLTLFGFVENPNRAFDAEGASATVTAALYQLSGNQKGMKIEDVTVMADGFGTFTDFSIDSHNLSTATSMQLLELVASPVGGNAPSRILTYVVRINNMVQNQGGNLSGLEARPEITFLDRTLTKPALQIGGRFATPRVMAMVDASKSVNPSGLPLEYIWRYRWLDNRPQEPGIFFNGFGTPMVSFDVPLPTTSPRSLEIQLSVKDAITGSVSPIRAVTLIDLLQSNDVPPVAMAGFIPKELFLGPNQNEISLFLDGSLSYSASGNALRVTWTHEFGFGVFGELGSRTSSTPSTKATAWLGEGPHRFRLTVVDTTNDKRKSEEFFTVDVRKPLIINPDLQFLVDGFADAFPRDAFVNEDIHISGSFFATSTTTLDLTKLKAKVLMDGTEIYSGDGSFISTSFSLSSTGSKIVTVQGWYDSNDNGNYDGMPNMLDNSSIREIFIPITVRKDEVPVAALIRMPSVVVAEGQTASIPATFAVAVDPTLLADENVYIEFFYDLFNMDFNAMPSAPLGGTVTSASGEASVMITGVEPGEYEVYLSAYPVRMVNGIPEFLSDSPAEAFAKVRVIGDEAQIRVSVFDPNGKLAAPPQNTGGPFPEIKLKVFGVNGPNLDFLAESGFPMFDAGFVKLDAKVSSAVLTQTTEFKLVVSNGLEASAEGYFAKDLVVNSLVKGLNEFFFDLSIVDELKVETAFIADYEPLDSDGNFTIVFSQRWQDGTTFALSRIESSSLTAASFTTGQYNVSSSNPNVLRFAIPYSKTTSDTGLRRDPNRPGEIRLHATLTGKDLDGNTVVRERHIGFPPSNDFLYWIPVDFTERPVNSMFTYEMLVGKGFDFFSFGSKLGTVSFTTDKMMLTYQGGSFTEESNYFITPNGVLETFRMDGTGNRFDERRYFTANVNQDGIFGSYFFVDSFTGMEFPGATPFSFRVPRPLTMRMPFEVEEIWPAEEGSAIVGFTYGIPNHLANHFRQISVDALIGTSGSTEPFMPATEVFMPGGYLVFKNLDAPEFIRLMESNAGANPDMPLQEISNFLRDLRMGNQLENKVMVEGMGSMQSSCVSSMSTGPCGLIRLHGVLPQEPVTMNLTFFFLPTMSVQPNPENSRELMPLENGVIGLALGHPGAVQLGEYLPHRSTIRIQHHSYPRMFDSSGVLMLDPYTASERLMAFHGERPHTVSPELEMNLMGRLAESRLVPGNASRFWDTLPPDFSGPVIPGDYHLSYLVETGLREGTATETETIVFARHSAGSILELANLEIRPGMMHPELEFYTTSLDGTLMNTSGALWPLAVDSSFSSGALTTVTRPIQVGSSVEAVFLDAHSGSGPSGTSSGPMSHPPIYAEEVVSLIMGRFPHLSVKVGDIVTTVHDILVVRNISSSFPIRCEAGGCVRDMDPMRDPGEVEVNTLFLARGIGPVIMVETEKGAYFDPQVGAFQPKGGREFGYASAFIAGSMESPMMFREGELMPVRFENPEMQLSNKRFHIFRRSAMDFGRMEIDFGPWDSHTSSGMGTMIEFRVDRSFHPGQILPTNNQPLIDESTAITYSVSNGDLVVSFQEDGQNMMFRLEGVLPRIFGTRMSFNVYEGQNPKSMEIMEWYSSMEHANNFFFQFFNYPMVEFWAESSRTAYIHMFSSGIIYNYHHGFFIQPKSSRPDQFSDPNDRINSFVIHGPGLPMEGLWFKGPEGYVSGGQPIPLQMVLPEFLRTEQEGLICPMGNMFCLNSDQAVGLPTGPLMYSAVFMTQMGNEASRYDLVIPARPVEVTFFNRYENVDYPQLESDNPKDLFPVLALNTGESEFVFLDRFSRDAETVTTMTVPAIFSGNVRGAGAGYFIQEPPSTMNTMPGQIYMGFGPAEFMGDPLVGTIRLPRLDAPNTVPNVNGIADVYVRDHMNRVFRTRYPIQ